MLRKLLNKSIVLGLVFLLVIKGSYGAVLSLDKVTYTSSQWPIVGDVFIAEIRQVGTQEYLVGTETTFQTDEINQKLEESGYKARVSYPLTVKTRLEKRECWWDFASLSEYIKSADIIWKKTCYIPGLCPTADDCFEDGGEYFIKRAYSFDYYCINIVPTHEVNYLSPDIIYFITEFCASNSEESSCKDVSYSGEWILPNKVWVEWTGHLLGERIEACPTTDLNQNLFGVYDLTTSDYWTGSKQNLNYYDEWCPTDYWSVCTGGVFEDCLEGSGPFSGWSVEDCVSTLNVYRSNAITGYAYADPTTGKTTYVDGSKVKLEIPKDYIIPSFKLVIDADWLGIYVPCGKPDIISVSTTPIDSQTGYGYVSVVTKNIGSEAGTFDFSVSCPSPWVGGSRSEWFEAGEQKTVTIPVSGSCTSEITKTCTVTVNDRCGINSDSATFQLTCKPKVRCTDFVPASTRECVYNVIRHCKADGEWEVEHTCAVGVCAYIGGKYRCEMEDDDGDGILNKYDKCPDEPGREENEGCPVPVCEWWDIPCWIRLMFLYLGYFAWIVIAGIISAIIIISSLVILPYLKRRGFKLKIGRR